MTVKIIKTGETVNVTDEYGARLIEQGRAVIAENPKPKAGKGKKEK